MDKYLEICNYNLDLLGGTATPQYDSTGSAIGGSLIYATLIAHSDVGIGMSESIKKVKTMLV